MKKSNHFISCALSVLGLALTSVSQAALVGYWKLNEGSGITVADSSGNGNTGTFVTGGAADGWAGSTSGVSGTDNSLNSTGYNSYINVPYSASLGGINTASQITISLWFNETYASAYAYPIAFSNAGGRAMFIQMGTGPGSNMYAWSDAGWGKKTINQEGAQNAWVNYALTWDGTAAGLLKAYRNGVQIGGNQNAATSFPTFTELHIAGGYGSAYSSVEGNMDEVAVYNSIEDVSAIYAKGLAGTSLVVPEPTALALLGLGSFGLLFSRRRR